MPHLSTDHYAGLPFPSTPAEHRADNLNRTPALLHRLSNHLIGLQCRMDIELIEACPASSV